MVTFEDVCSVHTYETSIHKQYVQIQYVYHCCLCLIFFIKLRWPKSKSMYDTVYERYGLMASRRWRSLENLRKIYWTRLNQCSLDISFLQKCKLFHILPTFLNFKLSKEEFHRTGACRRFKESLMRYELTQKTSTCRKCQLSCESATSSLTDHFVSTWLQPHLFCYWSQGFKDQIPQFLQAWKEAQ